MEKKVIVRLVTSLTNQFSLKTKVLNTIVSPDTLSELKDELTDLHKTLQMFIFY